MLASSGTSASRPRSPSFFHPSFAGAVVVGFSAVVPPAAPSSFFLPQAEVAMTTANRIVDVRFMGRSIINKRAGGNRATSRFGSAARTQRVGPRQTHDKSQIHEV